MMRVLLIAMLFGLCACQSEKRNEEAAKNKPNTLTDEQFASIGYAVKERGELSQAAWDAEQFGKASVAYTHIRATTTTKPGSQTYARFKVIRERYDDAEIAKKRFARLRDFDPALVTKFKNTDHDLRRGFCIGDEVVIVTTDAVMFSRGYLDEVTAKLKKLEAK